MPKKISKNLQKPQLFLSLSRLMQDTYNFICKNSLQHYCCHCANWHHVHKRLPRILISYLLVMTA